LGGYEALAPRPAAARAIVEGGLVRLVKCLDKEFCRALRSAGYLDGQGRLDPLEAVYQVSRGRIEVEGCGSSWGCVFRLLTMLDIGLDLFVVYRDLRRKGRKPFKGFRPGTLLYKHEGRVYEVLVLSEGYPVTLSQLVEWSRQSVADNHVPIVAVVDRTGVVTYYEARASRSMQ